jgi:gamma-glutamyl:cysteine ligase YbdK (ATP-grasp superfamily)
MTSRLTLPAFSAHGIELEYMIVDRETLDVRQIADRLLQDFAGAPASSVARGHLGWSNELVSHVVELKNTEPTPRLDSLVADFQNEIDAANRALAPHGACLLPTGMHPWMDPGTETRLWTADGHDIYRMYDRIFDCRRHGWSNLQSMHINLPFADDAEFERLHAAIRLVLPLIPALAASSPIADGQATGALDYRLQVYRTNSDIVPSLVGDVIPDTYNTRAEYEHRVFTPMYEEIAPFDPEGVLKYEWLNARAAIPRFDRNAIEIRLADTQECPRADLAIAAAVTAVIRCVYSERWTPLVQQQEVPTAMLHGLLLRTLHEAESAIVGELPLLLALGMKERQCTAGALWRHLIDSAIGGSTQWWSEPIDIIQQQGTLALRILREIAGDYRPEKLRSVYRRLAECLATGTMLR